MFLLPALLFILRGEPGRCRGEDGGFTFDGDIRHFAVATNSVYIATEEKLYQLSHDLTLVRSLTQRGLLRPGSIPPGGLHFHRVSEADPWNTTLRVNVLLPFVDNNTLISCGVTDDECGYCDILDLMDISNVVYRESIQVGPRRGGASVSVLVSVEKSPSRSESFILTAVPPQHQDEKIETRCPSDYKTINLYNTDDQQSGGIFSFTIEGKPPVKSEGDVEFVDGFQISSTIYLLSNVPSCATGNKVLLIWLEVKTTKAETFESLRSARLSPSEDGGDGNRLLASSVIPGGPSVLWCGVFSVDAGQSSTELVVFDISPDLSGKADTDPDFCSDGTDKPGVKKAKTLRPEAVLFRQNNMTSVLAVRQKAWMVFFIGTGDGQLIKLAVDKNYHTVCPTVLYRANDDRRVFPKMHLDQVDRKHVYVPFQNKMERVPVSKCSTYTNVEECWSAQDPYCVWCGSKSCTFEDDCKDSDWVSIPDTYQQKMVSHSVERSQTGQITFNIQTHLTYGKKAPSNFTCQFAGTSRKLCRINGPPPQFPQCTCILSEIILPAEGLAVSVKIRLGTTQLMRQLTLTNCSDIRGQPTSVLCQQCVKAGCSWSTKGCSWLTAGVMNDSVCQMMESRMNLSIPEISSITPSVVSFYGRNHAVMSGHNLSDVTRVRIQTKDCTPQESPVWNNTGVNLTFHIPSADMKGMAKVCALLPDSSCHGNTKINYHSLPFCANITPSCTWFSGKRKITLIGSHLEFVEGVTHSHALQEVKLPRNNNFQSLIYDTPAAGNTQRIFSSTVFLKAANETLSCSTKLTYYPDPEFTGFTSTRMGDYVRITIEKKPDKLEMTMAELSVWGIHEGKQHPCIMVSKETTNKTDFFTCEIQSMPDVEFKNLMITYGDKTVRFEPLSSLHQVLLILRILLVPCIIVVLVIIYRWQKKLTAEMNKL